MQAAGGQSVVGDSGEVLDQVRVEHWNSTKYGGTGEGVAGVGYIAELRDGRQDDGSLMVALACEDGSPDDVLCANFQVTGLVEDGAPVPALELFDENGEGVLQIVKHPRGHVLIPMKTRIRLEPIQLSGCLPAWLLTE